MLRSDDLLVLLEVARSGTFSGAASALALDHSTVSRRVTAMEAELGKPVVIRTAHGCDVTEFGRTLLERAERIEQAMAEIRGLDTPALSGRPTLSGLVRVLAPEAFGACFVAPVMAQMHRDFEGVTLELVTATRPLVQGSGADIEIGVGDPVSRRIDSFRLADYTLGMYASREYLSAKGEPTTVSDLGQYPLIYYIDALLRVSDLDLIDRLFPSGAVQIGSTSVHSQLAATRAGGGIGVLPNFLAAPDPALVRLLPDQVRVDLHFSAALAPKVLRRAAAVEVMQRIQEEVRNRRAELMPETSRRWRESATRKAARLAEVVPKPLPSES